MSRRLVLLLTLMVLINTTDIMFRVCKAEAKVNGATYIRADGSVDPPTVPISSTDNITYTFTSDINSSIRVERSNIIIDGDRYALNGPGDGIGLYLNSTSNVTVRRIRIQGFRVDGISLYRTDNSMISENIIETNGRHGICLTSSSNNTIVGNVITANDRYGISLQFVSGSIISGNNLTDNYYGIYFDESNSSNTVNGNIITASKFYGIHIYLSFGNIITANTITANGFYGIDLQRCTGINISRNNITDNKINGINVYNSSSNTIIRNDLATNKDDGISLYNSFNNKICENNISLNSDGGINLSFSSANNISENALMSNDDGISLYGSFNNNIYHNNFIENTKHWYSYVSANVWDNGVEGNYWDNYDGVDLNHNGIGNSWYEIDENNTDRYPLMGPFHSFETSLGYNVNVISNSTIGDFEYFESERTIIMRISNMTENQTFGFCRMCIPKDLMPPPYTIMIDDGSTEVLHFNETIYANSTHRWIYFVYECSTHEIAILSYYSDYHPLLLLAVLLITATLLALVVSKVRARKSIAEKHTGQFQQT